jgi:adenylate cyclase class 1
MLLDAPADDKQFSAWLKTLLPAPGRLDTREALIFLKQLAQERSTELRPLARPLREALLAAGLAGTVGNTLAGSPGPATAEALFLAVDMLHDAALREAALEKAQADAGSPGAPHRLEHLLAAAPGRPGRDEALAAEMRRLALGEQAAPNLFGAACTEPEILGRILAELLITGGAPAKTALRLIPLLPHAGVAACLGALPRQAHGRVHLRLIEAFALVDPEAVRRAAKHMGPRHGLAGPPADALAELLRQTGAAANGPLSPRCVAPWEYGVKAPTGPARDKSRPSPLVSAGQGGYATLKDQDLSHAVLADASLEGTALSACDLGRGAFTRVTFRRVRFSGSCLAACEFEACSFEDCAFTATDLSHTRLRGCRLAGCTFDFCDLSNLRAESCTLAGCAFNESSIAGAFLHKARLDSVRMRTCAAGGAHLRECSLTRFALLRSDLSGSLWERCLLRDGLFTACPLAGARLLDSECRESVLERCPAAGLLVLGGHTDNPHLGLARERTAAALLEGPLRTACAPAPALAAGPGADFVAAAAQALLRVGAARHVLAAMRARNQRRLVLAVERFTEAQGQFLRLLPALLGTDAFERAKGIAGVPVCAIAGHGRPESLPAHLRQLLSRHFPGATEQSRPATPALLLEAVYAIGSLGSVAQRASSDVDCWLCLSPMPEAGENALPALRAGLAAKLVALEAWAWEQFGLEVHFFPMPMEDVRRDHYGISDKESSGSAQAALLKEEFYRTALKLAGRDLLWWALPPGAAQNDARALHEELARLLPRVAAELVDLGQPRPIPPEEYFGACLWQIVKALHSPYKSVMKLGLLEKYAGQGRDMRLLCDRIKEAAMRGRSLAEDVDPYLSLFTSVRKHYRALGDSTSLGLIGECLRLKAVVPPEDLPPEFDGQSPPADAREAGTFAAALRLGGLVNLFMISAYRRIQEGIKAGGATAKITPEDLTRLGRRIAANFSRQPNKVELVPFLSDDIAFTELSFHAEKAPGKRPVWAVRGKEKGAGKVAVESLAPIRRDVDVARLVAWLLFNGIYDPKQVVLAEKTFAPIALLDLQALLTDLCAFFPRKATLEPDLDEYLKPERVRKAYVIVNLPVAADKNKILALTALYATNWGEVFCQSIDTPDPAKLKAPREFLRGALTKPLDFETEVRAFTPKKAACPRLKFD